MEQLKFRNYLFAIIYLAVFITVSIVFVSIFGIIMTYIFEDERDFTIVVVVGFSVIIGVWIIAGIFILLQKTVIVTDTEIKLCRGKKVKWIIEKSEIKECIYNRAHWYDFIAPISAINAFMLQFQLKKRGVSRKKYCFLSYKQVKQMYTIFNYPIRTKDSVFER